MGNLVFIPAFLLAAAVTFAAVRPVIALARRTAFYDHPTGYKGHHRATPFLGGLAVLAGFIAAVVAFGQATDRLWVILACALGLLAVGTLDDRFPVRPRWRVLAEVAAAIALDAAGLGWTVFGPELLNTLLTIAWVVGLCNAFNLMDNLDGATGTVAGVSAAGIGVVGLTYGDTATAAFAFALAGACAGFLAHNLARPARIFLGDGGSLPIGFLVAAGAIAACDGHGLGVTVIPFGALLAGLAIFDTTLVVISRRRAGVPLGTAGRDHLTHRMLSRLGSERRVALVLALVQAWLCLGAILGAQAGPAALSFVAVFALACGLVAGGVLESVRWRPVREPPPSPQPLPLGADPSSEPGPHYGAAASSNAR
jgi:UDP-GlcNAc:undecaprenyl-phosphate/decaprenyl-phosphate GlcNAc-1-phosphate transferase